MTVGAGSARDAELLAEQLDFYRADAESFDRWLAGLLDERNDGPTARNYRAGRARMARVFARHAPLGRVLEIAAGTGRLAELYAPHAESALLLDASPESLAIAARRLGADRRIGCAEADIFAWDGGGRTFDTVVFIAWLHHVPHTRLDAFWHRVEGLLAEGGRVIFDFPDVNLQPPGRTEVPAVPTAGYRLYAPVDGISLRDNFGRRWRVVHNLWDPEDLSARLGRLGWTVKVLGAGLFADVVLAEAHR